MEPHIRAAIALFVQYFESGKQFLTCYEGSDRFRFTGSISAAYARLSFSETGDEVEFRGSKDTGFSIVSKLHGRGDLSIDTQNAFRGRVSADKFDGKSLGSQVQFRDYQDTTVYFKSFS